MTKRVRATIGPIHISRIGGVQGVDWLSVQHRRWAIVYKQTNMLDKQST